MCYHSFSPFSLKYCTGLYNLNILLYKALIESTLPFGIYNTMIKIKVCTKYLFEQGFHFTLCNISEIDSIYTEFELN